MQKYIGAIDQGTTSTRFIIFDEKGTIIGSTQLEHRQIFPSPGFVEHDGDEIWENTEKVISDTLRACSIRGSQLLGIGITNQRETIIPFNPETGELYYNAIVWQDLRGSEFIEQCRERLPEEELREKTGLLWSPYFSSSKIVWLLENVDGLREKAEKGECVFGTMDTFLTYKLTGEVVTDVTNASRYMLMNIKTLEWDESLLSFFDIPLSSLPKIVPSIGRVFGLTDKKGPFKAKVPVCGILGDQQAALFGQACFGAGQGKNTYGTGCFLLVNTGEKLCLSKSGLISTVAYQIEGETVKYALEGSIAIAGSLVQWTRDNLKMVKNAKELDELAQSVSDCGGVYIVPAFSGLFAPYWRSDARGVIAGLTSFVNRAHICRAVLESVALQANDIFEAMSKDSGIKLKELKVDGGLTNSWPLMVFQSDILKVPVIRPQVVETTALGAAYAAGLTAGVWKNLEELSKYWKEQLRWTPTMDDKEREKKIVFWHKAVSRTLNWKTDGE